jgi:mono/diheme cytochrome c family protein
MVNRIIIASLAVLLAATVATANQPKDKVSIQIGKAAPTNGKLMYASYCAPCHGVDGKGHGPTASALKAQPTDLTILSKNNHGKFPDAHVVTVLQFGSELPSHGTQEMPVWGPILGNMNRYNLQDKQLRISNLSRYLETIQVK